MLEFVFLLIVIVIALGITGLFFYAVWQLQRTYRIRERFVQLLRILSLSRSEKNPVLSPTSHPWESAGVMNPAATLAAGRVHLFYRAVGTDGVSRIGYASSKDGVQFNDRLPYPVFTLSESIDPITRDRIISTRPDLVASGGSFAGAEDPRAVVIDDRLYLTFQAFSSWESLRIGVTSISVDDLMKKKWNFTPPVYLSPRGQVHKNWVIFPELFNGKFALLHGFDEERTHAQIEYLDTLDREPATPIKSSATFRDAVDPSVWDSKMRGAGPPPIKTGKGWLVLYHANDAREPHRYKVGALLLDLHDPEKILARTKAPILAPDAWYENEGAKAGIVYASGAVVYGDQLTVYYGGADSVVCSATNSLSRILRELTPVT